jgi:uncharacterized protein YndB with AHSA1/START domain
MNGFTLTRDIAAPQDRVWTAFTDGAEYAAWIWPEAWETKCEIDLRVGGVFHVESSVSGFSVYGSYVEIDPITRLVLTWRPTGGVHESLVTIALEPTDAGTRLTLTHDNFENDEQLEAHREGWTGCLDRLPGYLAVVVG